MARSMAMTSPQFVRQKAPGDRSGAATAVRAPLTGYAFRAMVRCSIFFLQSTIPMSCFVSIKGGINSPPERGTKGTLL
ncbi:hypothetical protein EN829_005935 [Mesorhizobium sp. M00.F.Ca.ET.186.01.1.1]|nr:hypothetical protein EN848_02730 [bacterium M00.F.Ca.ET.205.01.1.1]TGU54758.1 hypothetical protein EN795_07145 [bacterium M00.F.Ca.ET.152.01.1.1]TGV38468.1 hypothetical protein EN829_005935 [Mesorhizobium sp. M00.F.Ca.ET.186.01.1.1]TGZ44330.1 hypothetical protein EN805_07150 [bacterium M00.F.Ca.ET.162.01.1.1]TIW59536.1 MAG: hypothetical protein E5V48_17450 [Mesorhizobium sp.]